MPANVFPFREHPTQIVRNKRTWGLCPASYEQFGLDVLERKLHVGIYAYHPEISVHNLH